MIKVDTALLIAAAAEIAAQADIIEENAKKITAAVRNAREQERTLFIFKKSQKDIETFERDAKAVVEEMRNQSLFLKECAKRFRAAQGVAQVTIGKM